MNIKNIIRESLESDLEWMEHTPLVYEGLRFYVNDHRDEDTLIYTISKVSPKNLTIEWTYKNGRKEELIDYSMEETIYNFENGFWVKFDEPINESNDFDWVDDINPNPHIYIGMNFTVVTGGSRIPFYTIKDIQGDSVTISWKEGFSEVSTTYDLDTVNDHFHYHQWVRTE